MNKSALLRLIGAFICIMLVTGGIYALRSNTNSDPDYASGSASVEIIIGIPQGATGFEIAQLLVEKGVVKSAGAFFRLAVADKRSAQIAPGIHRIQTHIPAKEALLELLDPERIPNLIRIAEGAWTDEVLTQMESKGFSKSEIEKALKSLVRPAKISGNEGVFFPAQYSFSTGTTALAALQAMVDRFAEEAQASGVLAGSQSFTPMQLLTIASLAQAEGDTQDFTKISQVVRNRLKLGMPLQFDTTVQYITRTRGEVFLSTEATRIASPYNTYLHYGLPPGPIGNPGRAAMDAALHPMVGNWLYFITVKPGDTRFTESHDQFLIWKSEYEVNLKAGKFRNKS